MSHATDSSRASYTGSAPASASSKHSFSGKLLFQRWNVKVPPLELRSSRLGTKKFQEENHFWNSYILENQHDTKRFVVAHGLAPRHAHKIGQHTYI